MTTKDMDNSMVGERVNSFEIPLVYQVVKRLFDIVLSLIAMPFVLVLIVIFVPIIKLDTPGSAFFIKERVGADGRPFRLIKFRSMFESDDPKRNQVWTEENDPRITKVGQFIRKYRIDEFPQFINVLKGDMSIVGPRPETVYLTNKFSNENPQFRLRTLVKPGITGLAQVNGGYDLNPHEKVEFDIEYICNLSIRQDIKILLQTVGVVLFGRGVR